MRMKEYLEECDSEIDNILQSEDLSLWFSPLRVLFSWLHMAREHLCIESFHLQWGTYRNKFKTHTKQQ